MADTKKKSGGGKRKKSDADRGKKKYVFLSDLQTWTALLRMKTI